MIPHIVRALAGPLAGQVHMTNNPVFFINRVVISKKVKYKCFKAHNRRCELSQVYDFLAKRGVAHLTLQVGGYRF